MLRDRAPRSTLCSCPWCGRFSELWYREQLCRGCCYKALRTGSYREGLQIVRELQVSGVLVARACDHFLFEGFIAKVASFIGEKEIAVLAAPAADDDLFEGFELE